MTWRSLRISNWWLPACLQHVALKSLTWESLARLLLAARLDKQEATLLLANLALEERKNLFQRVEVKMRAKKVHDSTWELNIN